MLFVKLILIELLLLPSQADAIYFSGIGQNPGNEIIIEETLIEGISRFYRTDWSGAKKSFNKIKEVKPEDPRPYFFEAMMPFMEYFFVDQTKELAAEFLEKSEIAVDLSTAKLNKTPHDTTMVLLLSGLHGYRGLVAAGQNNHRVALGSGLTGFNYTRKLLSMDTNKPEAKIGRGMFYYMVGSIPNGMKWAANIVGLNANIEDGFNELKSAAESSTYIRNDALMMLMYLYHKEEMYEQAVKYAEELTSELQENVIFLYKKAEIYEDMGDTNKARRTYTKVVELNNSDLPLVTKRSREKIEKLENSVLLGSK